MSLGVDLAGEKLRSAQLFKDYQYLMRIWTHPWILKLQEDKKERQVGQDMGRRDRITSVGGEYGGSISSGIYVVMTISVSRYSSLVSFDRDNDLLGLN